MEVSTACPSALWLPIRPEPGVEATRPLTACGEGRETLAKTLEPRQCQGSLKALCDGVASLGAQGQTKVHEVISKIPRTAAYETVPGFTNISVLRPPHARPPHVPSHPHSCGTCSKSSEKSLPTGERRAGRARRLWLRSQESCPAEPEQAAHPLLPRDTCRRQVDPLTQEYAALGSCPDQPTSLETTPPAC